MTIKHVQEDRGTDAAACSDGDLDGVTTSSTDILQR